jgi:hypothetical protein
MYGQGLQSGSSPRSEAVYLTLRTPQGPTEEISRSASHEQMASNGGTLGRSICDGARVSGSSLMLRAKTEGTAARRERCCARRPCAFTRKLNSAVPCRVGMRRREGIAPLKGFAKPLVARHDADSVEPGAGWNNEGGREQGGERTWAGA